MERWTGRDSNPRPPAIWSVTQLPSGRSSRLIYRPIKINCNLSLKSLTQTQTVELLDLPVVALYPARPAVAARGAHTPLNVKRAPAAPPTPNVHDFMTLAHRSRALNHINHSAGEMKTTLSPRIIIVPYRFTASLPWSSSAPSSTRFTCISNPLSLPRSSLPPLRLTSTEEPRARFNTSRGLWAGMKIINPSAVQYLRVSCAFLA